PCIHAGECREGFFRSMGHPWPIPRPSLALVTPKSLPAPPGSPLQMACSVVFSKKRQFQTSAHIQKTGKSRRRHCASPLDREALRSE
ncbi:MAG: hypothetical protein WD772_12000, partial [Pseudohongiellaceae bacterium]